MRSMHSRPGRRVGSTAMIAVLALTLTACSTVSADVNATTTAGATASPAGVTGATSPAAWPTSPSAASPDTKATGASAGGVAAEKPADVKLPPANGAFDYQIGGPYTPPKGVRVVSRDRNAAPAAGLYNICYVNAFQVQPHEVEWWQKNHDDLLLRNADGEYVVDGDWNEILLDISTAAKRTAIAKIVNGWIAGCASKGFQAVEPDNIDSYNRSEDLLTKAHALAYLPLLTSHTHDVGLAIGQKGSTELGTAGKNAGLDFAIVEECGRYDECGEYTSVYGNNVIDIEYRRADFTTVCASHGKVLSIVLRDVNVTVPGSGTYVRDAC